MVLHGPLKEKEEVLCNSKYDSIFTVKWFLKLLLFISNLCRNKDVSFKYLINIEYQWRDGVSWAYRLCWSRGVTKWIKRWFGLFTFETRKPQGFCVFTSLIQLEKPLCLSTLQKMEPKEDKIYLYFYELSLS